MDLTLYGICFKINGSMNLLDYVQSNTPVPVEIMQQVMDQMDSVTQDELAFAEKMQTNWKKAVNEKVPLIMNVGDDGGYEITCSVPDDLLSTVRILTGLEDSKIVEEYTADYLKNICGIEAGIISVDVEKHNSMNVKTEPAEGFNLSDLDAEPEGPAFEDVTTFGDMETELSEASAPEPVVVQEPEVIPEVQGFVMESEVQGSDSNEEYVPDEQPFEDEYMSAEELPYGEEVPFEEEPVIEPVVEMEPVVEPEPAVEEPNHTQVMKTAMAGIYKELVGNIHDKNLDERLGLTIGQMVTQPV